MTDLALVAISNAGVGLLIMALGVPLIMRKVPMNHFYGVRFSLSFKSDKNWYDINHTGGKIMIGWSLLFILYGLYGLVLPQKSLIVYALGSAVVSLLIVIGMSIHVYIVARKIDRRNSGIDKT